VALCRKSGDGAKRKHPTSNRISNLAGDMLLHWKASLLDLSQHTFKRSAKFIPGTALACFEIPAPQDSKKSINVFTTLGQASIQTWR
jgi:hypothetical protein